MTEDQSPAQTSSTTSYLLLPSVGMAMGTAIIGTVIVGVALSSIGDLVASSTAIADADKLSVEEALKDGFTSADREPVEQELAAAPAEVQQEVVQVYDEAAMNGFQGAILVGGIVALLGALVAFWLPKDKIVPEGQGIEQVIRDLVRNTTVATVQLEMEDLPTPP